MPRPVALTRPEEETMSASITPASPVGTSEPPAPAWNRQRHSPMSSHRYSDVFSRVDVPLGDHRQWPGRRLTAAPLWVPVDLRDGNQALAEPMSPQRKRRFFELMVTMGYKEIEVGYPSASQTDYDFVRLLAETDLAPDDVTIVVFTPARRDLIERTTAAIRGIRNDVVIHLYTATGSPRADRHRRGRSRTGSRAPAAPRAGGRPSRCTHARRPLRAARLAAGAR